MCRPGTPRRAAAMSRTPRSRRRTRAACERRLHRRARQRGGGDGAGAGRLSARACSRDRRRDRRRRLGRQPRCSRRRCARCRSAAQADGVARSPRATCAPYVGSRRHHDDVPGRRRVGLNRISRAGARQRRARDGGHGRAPGERRRSRRAARARPDDVRRHHAVRAGGHRAARGRLRLPGLPRHRHRRAVDGEARRRRACSPACSTSRPPRSPTSWSAACFAPARSGWTCSRAPRIPYVGSSARSTWSTSGRCDTVPERFAARRLHRHNAERHADAHHGRRRTAASARWIAAQAQPHAPDRCAS